ncbi:MAG: L,D-transpeptidase family protein [Pseudomonadota bacterium]
MKSRNSRKFNYTVSNLPVHRAPGGPPHRGLIKIGWNIYPCALGTNGISVVKREGDGKTPAGRFDLRKIYLRPEKIRPYGQAAMKSRSRLINSKMGWCDDPANANYNREVKLPVGVRHEKLSREDDLYDVLIVIDWNLRPRIRGAGSAIFLHVAKPGFEPTEGCVAVSKEAMSRLLRRIDRNTAILIRP